MLEHIKLQSEDMLLNCSLFVTERKENEDVVKHLELF